MKKTLQILAVSIIATILAFTAVPSLKAYAEVFIAPLIVQPNLVGGNAVGLTVNGTAAGTVTSVSGSTASGVTVSVTNASTVPVVSVSLGAISPSSVTANSISTSALSGSFVTAIANGGTNQTAFTAPVSGVNAIPYFDGTRLVTDAVPSDFGYNAASGIATFGTISASAVSVSSFSAPQSGINPVIFNTASGLATDTIAEHFGYEPATDTVHTGILHIHSPGTTNATFTNTAAQGPLGGSGMIGYSDPGAAINSGSRLGFYLSGGSIDAAHTLVNSVGWGGFATENFSGTNQGSDFRIFTTPNGTTTASRRLVATFGQDGLLTMPVSGIALSTAKITGLANGTAPADAVNYGQLSAATGGMLPQTPCATPNVIDDTLATPPGSPVLGEAYLVAASGVGAWTGLDGHLEQWNGATWTDIWGRVVAVGDRVCLALEHGTVAGGFATKSKNIAQVTGATPGAYTYAFTAPANSYTVAINGANSPDLGHGYYYNGTSAAWVEFIVGGSPIASTGLTATGQTWTIDTNITVDKNTVQTLTNKTLTAPTLTTPVLGAATATSLATGTLSATGQITSTQATGSAPFVVSSTTPVANLSIGGNAATVTTNANLTGDVTSTGNATTLANVGGSTPALVHAAELRANAASSVNSASTLVMRDAAGAFAASTVTATVTMTAANVVATTNITTPSINGGQLAGFRNKLINGDMIINQVYGTASTVPATSTYVSDQWKYTTTQASKLTFQTIADAPAGFKYSELVTVAAQFAPATTDQFVLWQPVEGQNIVDLQFGVATAQTIAVSTYTKSSIAGTYSCFIQNASANRSYVGTMTVTAGWAKSTCIATIADTAGTWATDNTAGLWVGVDLGSGANFNTTSGSWQTGNFTRTAGSVTFVNQVAGSTFNSTGWQLEQVSSGATAGSSFEHASYADQLRWSQRYLPVFNSTGTASPLGSAMAFSTTIELTYYQFKVTPRIAPTGIVTSNQFSTYMGGSVFVTSAVALDSASLDGAFLNLTNSGMTIGQAGLTYASNPSSQIYFTGSQM